MTKVFGQTYADAYDLLYQDKNYEAECDLIERIMREHGQGVARTVLDLGCGTGNHARALARRGYAVTGVDLSAEMIDQARRKPDGLVRFVHGDILTAELGQKFDVALMMFAVLGYQVENDDVLAALRTARRHLTTGGLLVFDVWYGPAVLRHRPSDRVKVVKTPTGRILRSASGNLDTRRHLCTVQYQMWQVEEDRLMSETEEAHQMRYFFPQELDVLLHFTGFSLERLGAFPEFDREPDESTWNVLAVASVSGDPTIN